ncbi:choice-of-anchor D domain-containing protein [Coralliovum pocilloporae]|uniref:choice-of-anchor D domain-containing protein n=1 Tax=Coralliovum pocilloporae TaxID=3066369 RepID=UPI003307B1A9
MIIGSDRSAGWRWTIRSLAVFQLVFGSMLSVLFWTAMPNQAEASFTMCPALDVTPFPIQAGLDLTADNCTDTNSLPVSQQNNDFILIQPADGTGSTTFEIQEGPADARDLVYQVNGGSSIDNNGDGTTIDCSGGCTVSGTHGGTPFSFTYTFNTGTGQGAVGVLAPEIEVSSSESGGVVLDGGTDAQGDEPISTAKTVTYTVTNSGSATLNVTNIVASNLSNITGSPTISSTSFSIASGGGPQTFDVTYTPTATGAFSFELDITNDDSDENPYDILVSGTGVAPEIAVSSSESGGAVADGGTDSFASSPVAGSPAIVTYTIENTGTFALSVTPPTVGSNVTSTSNVTVNAMTLGAVSVAPGGTTTLVVNYTPTAAGAFSFAFNFANGDADENPYNITASGTAVGPPEIAVSSSEGGAVADGGTDTFTSTPAAGSPAIVTYTISNTGASALSVTPPTVGGNVTSTSNVTVNSMTLGAVSVAPGGTTTLVVNYTPTVAGAFSFAFNFANGDSDENPYNITASGTATGTPEIAVSSSESGGAVADGGTDTFTSTPAAGSPAIVTYTITNTGTSALSVTPPTVGGNVTSTSNVTVNSMTLGAVSVAPGGGTTTLVVNYTPTVAGAFSFDFNFANGDSDENPYNITASGTATGTPEIAVLSSEGGAVADGGTDTFTSSPVSGSPAIVTYTITNTGTSALSITPPTVGGNVTSTSNVTVNAMTLGAVSVAPAGGTTTLVVNYTPTAAGAFSFAFNFANGDGDENPYNITASGTAVGPPEIEVSSSEGGAVADGGTDTFTSTPAAGSPAIVTYTITNTGTSALSVTPPTVGGNVTSTSNVTVNAMTLGAVSVAPGGGTTTLVVNYTPTAAGAFSFDFNFANGDGDENPYNITASGTATGTPEIEVSSSEGGAVADGGTDTFTSTPAAGSPAIVTYTITNTGTSALSVTPPTVGGNVTSTSNVTVNAMTLGAVSVAPGGGTTTLVVNYTPTAAGAFSFAFNFANGDGDENPYNITASGIATGAPEIEVSSSEGGAVADGGTDAFTSTPVAGVAGTVTYTITNSGTSALSVTAPTVGSNVSATTNVVVNSLTLGSTSVAPGGGTTTLVVNYTPTNSGAFSFAFDFANGDADENPFNITASGNASGTPEIEVSSSEGGAVADGGTDTFTSTPAAGSASTVTYTITNTGTSALSVTPPTVGGNVTSTSNVTVNSMTLGAVSVTPGGGTTTLVVNYTPTAAGAFSFAFNFANSDADENPYNITASGAALGVPAALAATSGSGQITEINTAFGSRLVATLTDASGNGVANEAVTFTAPASGASLTFASTGTNTETVTTDANGEATSSIMTANSVVSNFLGGSAFEPYMVTAQAAGVTDVTFSLTNTRDSSADITKTQEVIASFVTNRADRIVSEQPDLVDRLKGGAFGRQNNFNSFAFDISSQNKSASFEFSYRAFVNKISSLGERSENAPEGTSQLVDRFSAFDELEAKDAARRHSAFSQETRDLEETFATLAFDEGQVDGKQGGAVQSGFDFWAKGTYAAVENGSSESENGIFFAGVDYRFRDDALIGLMGQLDISDEENTVANTSADGIGWMVGPYAVVRLHDNLYLDGRATYGQSYNQVNALGLFSDDFDTQRVLIQGGLTGDFDMGPLNVNPFLKVTYFWEEQESYTDTLGNLIPSQDFDLGRLEFGPRVSYDIQGEDDYIMSLFMSLSGIYDFNELRDDTATTASLTSSSDSVRARIEAGAAVLFSTNNIRVTGEGFYDGIGVRDFEAYGGSLSVNVPF